VIDFLLNNGPLLALIASVGGGILMWGTRKLSIILIGILIKASFILLLIQMPNDDHLWQTVLFFFIGSAAGVIIGKTLKHHSKRREQE